MSKQQLHYCVQCCLSSVQCFIIIALLYSSSTRCYFYSPLPSSHVALPENTVLTASNTITQSHLPPIWSTPSSQGLKSTAIPSRSCQRRARWWIQTCFCTTKGSGPRATSSLEKPQDVNTVFWLFIAHCWLLSSPSSRWQWFLLAPGRDCSHDPRPSRGFAVRWWVCVVSSSSKCAVTMSWKRTALEAALETEHGAKLRLVPETCHKYFKKKKN